MIIHKGLTYKRSPTLEKSDLSQLIAYSPPVEERTQAPVDSVEVLWDRKKHLQGIGASTSLKSIIFPCILIAEKRDNSIPFIGA